MQHIAILRLFCIGQHEGPHMYASAESASFMVSAACVEPGHVDMLMEMIEVARDPINISP